MKPLVGREAILAWRERAEQRVKTRRARASFGLGKLTPEDAERYMELIREHFEDLRAKHNARVAKKP